MKISKNINKLLQNLSIDNASVSIAPKYNELIKILLEFIMSHKVVEECIYIKDDNQYKTLNSQALKSNTLYVCKNKNNRSVKIAYIANIPLEQAVTKGENLFFINKGELLTFCNNNTWEISKNLEKKSEQIQREKETQAKKEKEIKIEEQQEETQTKEKQDQEISIKDLNDKINTISNKIAAINEAIISLQEKLKM